MLCPNPYLYSICEKRLVDIEKKLKNTYKIELPLLQEIKNAPISRMDGRSK